MSNIIDPRAKQIITNANGDIIQSTLSDFNENLPTNLPTNTPAQATPPAQDSTHPLTPSAVGGGNKEDTPTLARGNAQDSTQNPSQLAQATPTQIAQNPLQTQDTQTRYARDIDSTQKSSDYTPPTTQTKTYSLNKHIINDIDAENAQEALDLLRNTPTNISWEGVDNALNNGISPSAILERFADIAEQNPRALWISLERPLSKAEQARARFDYERGQISQDELDNLKSQTTLKSLSKSLFGLDSSEKQKANLTLAKFAERGESYENLPKEAQSVLNIQGKDSYSLNIKSIFTGKSEGELLYEQKQEEAKIYQKIKNKESLSQDELDTIDAYGAGAGFGSDKEKQEQWLLKYEANNIIPSYTQSMVYALENKADYKALFFGSGKGKQKDKERFLHGLDGIAKLSGFDSASVDEKSGDIFFTKDDFSYQVNTRFLDNIENTLKANAFSITGSIAGSMAGAKALGKNPFGLVAGIVGGGALGAFAGGTLDGVIADLYTNNKINFAENLRHGLHEGIFNIAGDAIVAGAIKGGKYIVKAGKNFTPQGIKEGISNATQGIKNLTNNILEYSIVGQAAKNVFDGNASAVRNFLKDIPQEQRESIRQGIKDFGLELELNPKSNQALSNFTAKYGEAHPNLANTAQKVYDIFTLPTGKELQQELISAIRADNTGGLVGFLTEAANSSPALQQSLHNILNQTHARAINHLKSFGLKQNDIAQIFEAYQKGTKEAYAKALDMIQEVFKDDKAKVSRKNYDLLTTELKQSALDEKELNYLKTLEAKIYGLSENGSPRSFENLKDALALLNEKWNKHAKNMNFTGEKLRRVEKQMREDIKQGINEIFASSAQGDKFRELFESALADYGNMKGILKAVDKLKLRDTDIAYQKTLNKMLDFLIAGEKGDLSNLAKLTAHLPKEQKIKFELATLNALLEKSIFSAKNGDSVVLEVLNSGQFLSRLESIAGEFSTPQAKEYIDFVKEFHSLFKNDYAIGQATLEPALTQKISGGIATTPMGRFEYQRAKLIYDSIVRLMPRIPFMSSFNEKVSAAAVRFHLRSALRKSHSIGELKRTLDFKAQEGKFDSPTNRVISQIMGEVESSYDGIIKELNTNTQNPNTNPQAQKAKNPPANAEGISHNPPPNAEGDTGGGYELAKSNLQSAPAQPTPTELNQTELELVLAQFDNVENLKKHFAGKPDEKQRYALFSLLQDTLLDPLIKYTSAGKQKYLQKFASKSEGEPFFYMLVTQDKDKTFITHLKTRDMDYLVKDLAQASEIQKGADLIGEFTSWGGSSKATSPTSTYKISGDEEIITQTPQNLTEIQKKDKIKQDIFSLAKEQKEAQKQAQLEKAQADSDFIAKREAHKQARIDKILAEQKASQGSTTLEARAKIKAEQMGEDIPYTRLSDTHIILDDITYPAEFVIIDKADLKPSFEAGGFQTREVKQDNKIAQIRDNFDPLKIFGKVGEYDGLPLIARNGEIIAGNHRGQAIKELSGENLARYNEYAKKVFGVDLPQDKIIVRKILDDTEHENGANLLEQIALAARSNKGAETTLGEQATSALGTYKDKIQTELLENKARRYIESDSVDNQMQAVANILKAPLKAEEANLALLASLSKASHNLDIAKALDMIEGDDLLKAKIKNMLIANAGGFYNISRSIATPKLNEITNYLVDAIAYLGKASKQSGSENINRSEAYRELASIINDRVGGKVQTLKGMETPLSEFIAQTKADALGASLSKFANQDHASQRLYEVLRDMPEVLEKKFAEPSFDFFGDAEVKALKSVDMYDFLDYMIGRGQQNQATSELKDALIGLKKLESSLPNNTPPTKPSPQASATKANAENPTATKANDSTQPKQSDQTNADNATQNISNKTTLQKDLSTQEIKEAVQKWDLDNPNTNDKLLVSLVQGEELEKLSKEFDFKGNYAIAREIDSKGIKHALIQHGDKEKESARGQIAITKDDIAQYQHYTQNPDLRILQENNRIVYAKQVNGHYVVIEEVLTGQNKLQFFDMWKGKGKINKEVLLSHSQRPKHDFEPNSNRHMPSNTDGIIPQPAKNTTDNPPKTLADLQDPRYERHKNLESSLDSRFNNFEKQAKDNNLNVDKWFEAQRAKGNKEILEYDKDLAEYRKLDDAIRIEKQEKENKAYYKKATQDWLEKQKHNYTNKTDNEIITTQGKQAGKSYDEAKHLLAAMRKDIERNLDLHPIAEFGTNYAEFYQDGKGAIAKLIAEANAAKEVGQDFSGQVAGAFYREDLGDITLAWGDSNFGLKHILEKRSAELGEQKALDFVEKIPEIIQKGKLTNQNNVRYRIEFDNFVVGLSAEYKGEKQNFVITAFERKGNADFFSEPHFKSTSHNAVENPNSEIIPQTNIRESLNDTLKTAYDIFKAHNKDEANDKLFDRVIEIASKLDVRYWEQVNPKWVNGTYTFWLNRAMVDTKLLKADPEQASQTILHELIHGVTSRAIYAYDNGLHELLSKTQIEGITELKNLYNEVRKNNASKAWIKYENSKEEALLNKNKIYGLNSEHEFLAELANKSFRDFLKEQNLFTRIINAVAKIFGYTKKTGDEISTNAYKEAQEVLYKIMDNHKENFTRDFDDYYKKLDFMDLDNYKKYLKKHSERVKTHKDSIYLTTLAKAGVNSKNLIIGEGVYRQTLGVKHYSELKNTPLTKILKDIIESERIKVSTGYGGLMLDDKNTQHFIENLTILKGLSPFFTSGLYKKVDENYARYLLENLKNIGNRRITYRNNIFNTFFAKEFADREIEKLTKGDLYSLGIIDDNFLTKDKKMASNILQDDKINYAYLKEIATPLKKIDNQKEFLDAFAFKNNKTIGNVKTPIKEVEIDLKEAWEHLLKNSKQENRLKLAGGILPTLREPNIISVDKNRTYYFYKAFSDEKGVLNLVSIELPKSNRLKYKTSYIASKQRLLKVFNEYEVVYENLQKARPPTA